MRKLAGVTPGAAPVCCCKEAGCNAEVGADVELQPANRAATKAIVAARDEIIADSRRFAALDPCESSTMNVGQADDELNRSHAGALARTCKACSILEALPDLASAAIVDD
jgi:hypothetical protein